MANLSAYYISFLLCFTTCINLISSHYPPENHVALFIFGDSLFDPGNNNYINTTADFRANFYPYGETFFKYPTGRFSDGRLIPDFIGKFTSNTLQILIIIKFIALWFFTLFFNSSACWVTDNPNIFTAWKA